MPPACKWTAVLPLGLLAGRQGSGLAALDPGRRPPWCHASMPMHPYHHHRDHHRSCPDSPLAPSPSYPLRYMLDGGAPFRRDSSGRVFDRRGEQVELMGASEQVGGGGGD